MARNRHPSPSNKPKVSSHYDASAETYHEQYRRESLTTSEEYPSNYFRLQILVNSMLSKSARRVVEVGVGEGTPLVTLSKAGMDAWGFDISKKMVEKAKQNFKKHGFDPDKISWGDVQDSITFAHCLREGAFDALIAMGVMPHVEKDEVVLRNMAAMVRPGGTVFIEFRNKLFSLFTFNRYTIEFIRDDLLGDVDPELKDAVVEELTPRLWSDLPPRRETVAGGKGPGYDAILSKFHNPLEMPRLFGLFGFEKVKLHWYHYHPALPVLERKHSQKFRDEALRLEGESSGWRGLLLCSAYVVEAERAADTTGR